MLYQQSQQQHKRHTLNEYFSCIASTWEINYCTLCHRSQRAAGPAERVGKVCMAYLWIREHEMTKLRIFARPPIKTILYRDELKLKTNNLYNILKKRSKRQESSSNYACKRWYKRSVRCVCGFSDTSFFRNTHPTPKYAHLFVRCVHFVRASIRLAARIRRLGHSPFSLSGRYVPPRAVLLAGGKKPLSRRVTELSDPNTKCHLA